MTDIPTTWGGAARAAARPLVGRVAECEALHGFLDATRAGGGGTLRVEGPAGIGKTALLESTLADLPGWFVLHARASRVRWMLAYSGLSELLAAPTGTAPSDGLRSIAGADRAEVEGAAPAGDRDPLSVGLSFLHFLAELAERRPVLVAVDDVHWLDASSAEALAFVAERIDGDRIALMLARRDSDPLPTGFAGYPVLTVGAMDAESGMSLIGDRMALDVARRVVDAAGGNPLAILEACEVLSEPQRLGHTAIDRALPVPGELEQGYVRRLDELGVEVRAAVLLAACDERLERGVLVSAGAALGIGDPASSVGRAEAAGLLRQSDTWLSVAHPLLGSAAYRAALPDQRRAAHGAIAATLRRESDAERRAWHLADASAGPDEAVAALLDAAGRRALERGDPHAAGACFGRAAHLTEPSPRRAARATEAGAAYTAAGRAHDALAAFDAALADAVDAPTRAAILVRRCVPAAISGAAADEMERMRAEIEAAAAFDPVAAAVMSVYAAFPALVSGALPQAQEFVATARRLTPELDPSTELVATGMDALLRLQTGDTTSAVDALRSVADAPALVEQEPTFAPFVANGLSWADDFDRALRLIDATVQLWRERDAPGLLASPLGMRAEIKLRMGLFIDARADADEARRLALGSSRAAESSYALCVLARAEAALGRHDLARESAIEAMQVADANGIGYIGFWGAGALGFVELCAGNLERAVTHLERCAALLRHQGIHLASMVPWAPDLLDAYVQTDAQRRAAELVDEVERTSGASPTAWTRALVGRGRGMLAAPADIDAAFADALAAHAELDAPFDAARTRLAYGERLHRDGRVIQAREELEQAAAVFTRLHAAGWRSRAERFPGVGSRAGASAELLATLTPREYQVARAVAGGASNAEAAAELFVSRRTLESHLQRVYRKLDVRSRTRLAQILNGLD